MRHLAIIALSVGGLGVGASTAHAQAWVGDKGTLDVSPDYNPGLPDQVVSDTDLEFPRGGVITHQVTLGAEYVPIQHLAISASMPFVALKFRGDVANGDSSEYPHPGGGSYDDGSFHSTLTDLRVNARYQFLEEPVAIAPHIGVSIPVADYETIGNAVAGRHLKQLHLGIGVGRAFDTATYVHALYEFSLVERFDETKFTERYNQNKSLVNVTIGQKLLEYRFDVHADLSILRTHGGWNFSQFGNTSDPAYHISDDLYHDALLDEDLMLLGGGIGYQLTNSIGVTASARLFLTGQNTQNASVYALGVTWSKG